MSRHFFKAAFALLLLAFTVFGLSPARAEEAYLEPEAAFRFSARMVDPETLAVTYAIADGYYMYRERFKFRAEGATLGEAVFPKGKVKFDDTFQKNVETYRNSVTITLPVKAAGMFTVTATSQGCADAGLCYAPQDASARLVGALSGGQSSAGNPLQARYGQEPAAQVDRPAGSAPAASAPSAAASAGTAPDNSEQGTLATLLGGGKLLVIIPAFILLGLGLSFTPCVLPMVPILASIIVGSSTTSVTRARGFTLAAAYSLGMALVYTVLGVAAGLIGEGLSASLQNPWVLGTIGLLMTGMALSMFGVYELQLPSALQTRLVGASGRMSAGKLAGVFGMGALSALIVGPCVAAPLVGALVYIGQTRDVVIGGLALFSMAAGMSIPLLLVGLSAGTLLPHAGAWMDQVKKFFGVLMLAVALWLVSPVLPPLLQMLLWSALLIGYGAYLLRATRHWAGMALAAACAILGAVQLTGAATGGRDVLAPLGHFGPQAHGIVFKRIKTVAQLDAALAANQGRTAMLDFYADWCVSCKEMEKLTFVDPGVQRQLADTLLLQVDVTANDADDKAMLKRFGLYGPPSIILFGRDGKEVAGSRVVGYQDAGKFSNSLRKLQ
ncbi:MAG TPA: protein-disulfide reductase DsbD [Telluria sp.]|jgi:thiol:disulfide interchange protein DsbD